MKKIPPDYLTKLLYGSGLRVVECVRLRVKDVDFNMHQIRIGDVHNIITY